MKGKFKKGDVVYFRWGKEALKFVASVLELEHELSIKISSVGYIDFDYKVWYPNTTKTIDRWSLEGLPDAADVYLMDKETLDEINYYKDRHGQV